MIARVAYALAYYVNPMRRVLFMTVLGNHDVNASGPSCSLNSSGATLKCR